MSELKAFDIVVSEEGYGAGIVKYRRAVYDKNETDKIIRELEQRLEDAKATTYSENVDAGMRERKLKRALWIARANAANARKEYWHVRCVYEADNRLWSIDGSAVKYLGCIKRPSRDWLVIWSEIEIKCLRKAEMHQ